MLARSPHDEAEAPEVLERETVYRGAVWDVVREEFRYAEGTLQRDYVNHPGASAVVAVDAEGKVVLLKQYRHPVRSRNWEIPAGLLDQPGEDPLECAQRELAEEASLAASEYLHLGTFNVSPGGSNEVIHIYLARGLSTIAHDFEKTGEEADLEVVRWPLDVAVEAVRSGQVKNQIAAMGLLLAHDKIHG